MVVVIVIIIIIVNIIKSVAALRSAVHSGKASDPVTVKMIPLPLPPSYQLVILLREGLSPTIHNTCYIYLYSLRTVLRVLHHHRRRLSDDYFITGTAIIFPRHAFPPPLPSPGGCRGACALARVTHRPAKSKHTRPAQAAPGPSVFQVGRATGFQRGGKKRWREWWCVQMTYIGQR